MCGWFLNSFVNEDKLVGPRDRSGAVMHIHQYEPLWLPAFNNIHHWPYISHFQTSNNFLSLRRPRIHLSAPSDSLSRPRQLATADLRGINEKDQSPTAKPRYSSNPINQPSHSHPPLPLLLFTHHFLLDYIASRGDMREHAES